MLKKIKEKLKSFDIYGVSQEMTFMQKSHYQSLLGFILSLFFFSYFIFRIIDYIINYINKQTFTQVNNLIVEDVKINITNFAIYNCLYRAEAGRYDLSLKFSDYFTPANDYQEIVDQWIIEDCKADNDVIGLPEKLANKLLTCSCGYAAKENIIATDIYRFNETGSAISYASKPAIQNEDTSNWIMLTYVMNFYFDYKKNPPFQMYPMIIETPVNKKKESYIKLDFENMRYNEIIDFDIFYKKQNDWEQYKIKDSTIITADTPYEDYFYTTFAFVPHSFVNVYDITLLSIDNILAVFNGTFTILMLLFTSIGNYFNSKYYNNAKKKLFYNLRYLDDENKDKDPDKESYISNLKKREPLYKGKDHSLKDIDESVKNKDNKIDKIKTEKVNVNTKKEKEKNSDVLIINDFSKDNENVPASDNNNNYEVIDDDYLSGKNLNVDVKINNFIQMENEVIYKDVKYVKKVKKDKKVDYEKKVSEYTLGIFDSYVSSFEFLFDLFTQMELIKKMFLDQETYRDFNFKSKKYLYEYVKEIIKSEEEEKEIEEN